jgi:hypothetical protein
MRYCEISKEMSSLYFGLAVFCLFGTQVVEFFCHAALPPNSCGLYSVHCTLSTASNSGTLASNWQNASSPKYNDDISLLISQYLISAQDGKLNGSKIFHIEEKGVPVATSGISEPGGYGCGLGSILIIQE